MGSIIQVLPLMERTTYYEPNLVLSVLSTVFTYDVILTNAGSFQLLDLPVIGGALSLPVIFHIPGSPETSLSDVFKEPAHLLIKTVCYDESVIIEPYLCKTLIIQISFVYVSAKH